MSLNLSPIDLSGRGFAWFLSRPITKEERYQFRVSVVDNRPMSLLGISSDDRACVTDEETAHLFRASPELYSALEASIYALEKIEAITAQHAEGSPEHFTAINRLADAKAALALAKGDSK